MKVLAATVFPSTIQTIGCHVDDPKFDGAHNYEVRKMLRFENGQAVYCDYDVQLITFVKRNEDGTWQRGIQTEQLLHLLIDRHKKLSAVFPAEEDAQFFAGIDLALDALERRVRERTARGVMGQLQK